MKYYFFLIIILLLGFNYANSFFDSLDSDFSLGTFFNTTYGNDSVYLDINSNLKYYSSGTFLSRIFDSQSSVNYSSLKWQESFPYGTDLPNNNVSDAYIDMTNNNILSHFNVSDYCVEDVANNYPLGVVGTIVSNSGKFGNAANFDNLSFFHTGYFVPPATNSFSISLWIKTSTKGRCISGWSDISPSATRYDRELKILANGTIEYMYYLSSTNTITSITNVADNEWHFITIVYDSSAQTYTLYVDGSNEASVNNVSAGGTTIYNKPRLNIGNCYSSYFNGLIDDYVVWDKALTQSDIATLYNSGTGLEVSTLDDVIAAYHFEESSFSTISSIPNSANNSITFTINPNSRIYSIKSPWNYGLGLVADGVIYSSSYTPPTNFTISTWVKTKYGGCISGWANNTPGSGTYDRDFYIVPNTGYASFYIYPGGTVTGITDLRDNKWHHVLVTVDTVNAQTKLYVDGVLERTRTRADAYNGYTNPRLNIGQCPKGSYLNGELEEYAIWHNVLTYQEILDLYLRGAAKLNLQVRACNLSDCSDESFVGPNGINSYFEDGNFSYDISSLFSNKRYFQYKSFFETNALNSSVFNSPKLLDVTIGYIGASNSSPSIDGISICKTNCDSYKVLTPGIDDFVIKVEVSDPDGASDINWDSAMLKIYNSDLNFDANVSWDFLEFSKLNNTLVENNIYGCTSSSNIKCYYVSDANWTTKFLYGGANIYFEISDFASNNDFYEYEYIEDLQSIYINKTNSISIDVLDVSFDGNPDNVVQVETIEDMPKNYINISHNGNADINVNLYSTDLNYNNFIIASNNIYWNITNVFDDNKSISLSTILPFWSRGIYPNSNTENIYLWLDIPNVPAGEYSGNIVISGEDI